MIEPEPNPVIKGCIWGLVLSLPFWALLGWWVFR